MYTKCVEERRELKQHTIYKVGKLILYFTQSQTRKEGLYIQVF